MNNRTVFQNNENSNPSNRRDFLKSAALFGAATCVPAVLVSSCTSAEQKTISSKESQNENIVPVITERRTLGKGTAAMEVSALGFGVLSVRICSVLPQS